MSKSHWSLSVSFSGTNAGLRMDHLFVWSNLDFLHISQWISLPTKSCLLLLFFRANCCIRLLCNWWIHFLHRIAIYKALCFDVAQGRMNGAPNETRTQLCRFSSLACKPLHHQRCPFCHRIAYICYFVASYQFSFWYDWFLWHWFLLQLGDSVSLLRFLFLVRSRFSRVRCCLLVV